MAAGLRPDPLGELKRSPRLPSREKGERGRGRGGQWVGERGEGKGYGTGKDKGVRKDVGGWKGEGRERGKERVGRPPALLPPPLASASNTTLFLGHRALITRRAREQENIYKKQRFAPDGLSLFSLISSCLRIVVAEVSTKRTRTLSSFAIWN